MTAPGSMPLCVATHTVTYVCVVTHNGMDPGAVMCDNTYSDICMIIHGDSCFNLVKSANRYRLHMTVCSTTRAYNGTIATKGLFIMCPSANIIGIKNKLFLRANDLGIYFRI